MKAKRIVAWLLVCVLQLSICLLIPLHGRIRERQMEREGESYRFAVHSVRSVGRERHGVIYLEFPPPVPWEGEPKDTVRQVIETGKDNLARVYEKAVTYEEAEQTERSQLLSELPLYGAYSLDAAVLADDDTQRDLDALAALMELLQSYMSAHPDNELSFFERDQLRKELDKMKTEPLRALGQRQIDEKNGDVLRDSWVTGVVYQGAVYYREVFVAGIHVASVHN